MKVPLSFPSIEQGDIENVRRVLESGQLVQGCYVQSLEKAFADLVGVEYAVAVSSGTATLHIALLSIGIGPGDEVIVPAFSFVATANVVELVGAKPIFVDINSTSFNIDTSRIIEAITPSTKVLMPVHEFGYPAEMDIITEIANEYGLAVVEDAACALGAEWMDRKAGSWGNIGSFSLHPRKAVTSGEGGVLTTNDAALAKYFRIIRNHGIDNASGVMDFVAAGFNYRMTDMQAALVVGQLERLETILAKRNDIVSRYEKELNPHFYRKPKSPLDGRTTWQSYHIVLDDEVHRSDFQNYLLEKGIGSNYGAQCIPVQNYYRNKYGYRPLDFPEAYRAYTQGVALPLFDSMTSDQISYVIDALNTYSELDHVKR